MRFDINSEEIPPIKRSTETKLKPSQMKNKMFPEAETAKDHSSKNRKQRPSDTETMSVELGLGQLELPAFSFLLTRKQQRVTKRFLLPAADRGRLNLYSPTVQST